MRRSWIIAAFTLLLSGSALAQDKWVNVQGLVWEDADGKKYKIENCNLMVSASGESWESSPDGRWKDMGGVNYRLMDQKVESSADGNNWMENNAWKDAKGHDFRLNDGCMLYTLQVNKVDLKWDSKHLADRINRRLGRIEQEIARLNTSKLDSAKKRQEKLAYSRDQLKQRLGEIGSLKEDQWATFKTRVDSLLSIR